MTAKNRRERRAAAKRPTVSEPVGNYMLLDFKKLGGFSCSKGGSKPAPAIAKGLTQWPAEQPKGQAVSEKFFVPIHYPCSKVVLLNKATNRETVITYSWPAGGFVFGGKDANGESFLVRGQGEKKFTVHAALGHKHRMGKAQFINYSKERFGIEGLPELLELVAEMD